MHFRVCPSRDLLRKMKCMRAFPLIAIALLCSLTALTAPAIAQQLHCNPCYNDFGTVQVGNSVSYSFNLSNAGKNLLTITAKSIQGTSGLSIGKFTLPVKLQPGASVQLPVIFAPTAKGYAHAYIQLKSSDPRSPLYLRVHGSGGGSVSGAQLNVSPSSLSFGNVTVGSSTTLQATLTASGSAVTISSDGSTSSEFAIVGVSLPVTLQSGNSLAVTIQFTPNQSGKGSGSVGFTSNAVNSPTVVQVSGTGVAPGSHSVALTWDPGDGSAVGYNIYRSNAQNGPFAMINTSLDSSTNYTDNTVVSGSTYYYVTTEVNSKGQESGYSNEVQAVIPTP